MTTLLDNLPDKTEYKNTTSKKFKLDLIEFFQDKKLSTCLEIGTNHGHTTYILSHLFETVYTIDLHKANTDIAKQVNKDRDNIVYITGDAYNRINYSHVPEVDAAFIDCVHTYNAVLYDMETSVRKSSPDGMYLIFDDYSHPQSMGVHRAIEESIQKGLSREKLIGEEAGYTFKRDTNPTTLVGSEGIILRYVK